MTLALPLQSKNEAGLRYDIFKMYETDTSMPQAFLQVTDSAQIRKSTDADMYHDVKD